MKVTGCILLLLMQPMLMLAQYAGILEASFGAGQIIKNFPAFPELEQPAYVASFHVNRKLQGESPWHQYYNYPEAGLQLTFGTMGNKQVLGNFAGAGYEMTFIKPLGSKFFWAPRLSCGGAWFFKPFNEFENNTNIVIGSNLSFLVSAEAILGYRFSRNFGLLARASIYHSSNSHFKLPNVGMNLPVFSLGVRYHLRNESTLIADTTVLATPGSLRFHFRVALGMNEQGGATGPVNGPKYPVYLASAYVSKMVSPVNKITAGVEGWFNQGSYDFIVSQQYYDKNPAKKSMSFAVVLGHEFLMGHWGLITTTGFYLYNPFYRDRNERNNVEGFKEKLKGYIPARIGMQYYLKNTVHAASNNFFMGVYIKTNFGQADFLESGLGYQF